MIGFLRKYQRIFFAMITVIIIATFTFFGTYSATQRAPERVDRVIGKTIDGQPLKQNEIKLFSHFLSFEGISHNSTSNIFNDGVITQDFLRTGLAHILSKRYFEQIQPELQLAFEKSKKWSFYSHPQVPFLSAREIWKKLQPEAIRKIEGLSQVEQISVDHLDDYLDLQLSSKALPSDYMKQILLHQQSQLPWITPDQRLIYEDLSLFGFHQVGEWMGSDFLDLISQFLINAASVAEKKGYSVSWEEAKLDLYRNAYHYLNKMRDDVSAHTSKKDLFDMHLRYLGMDEKKAVSIWQKVLLFRKLMTDVAQNVFVDSLSIGDFASFVNQKANIVQYSLSPGLQLQDFTQLMEFQIYLKAIGPYLANDREYLRSIPEIFFSLEDIEKRTPELVEKCYEISYKKVDVDALGVRISEKQLWDWQLDLANWTKLQQEYPSLATLPANSRDDRFESLESLSSAVREKVDGYSRTQIVLNENHHWISAALIDGTPLRAQLHLRSKGGKLPLEGIDNSSSLAALLDKAPIANADSLSDEQKQAQEALSFFTDDHKTYYSIEVLRKAPQKRVITFAEGKEDGTLLNLVDHYLEPQYTTLRHQNPKDWKDEKGNWLSLYEAREKLGKILFSDLLSALDQEESSLDFYAKSRFVPHLEKQRETLQLGQNISALVLDERNEKSLEEDFFSEAPQYAFHQQWMLVKQPSSIDRNYKDTLIRDKAFALNSSSIWSDTFVSEKGATFFFFEGFEESQKNFSEEIARSKSPLAYEAVCELGKSLIDEIQEKQAIVIPVYQETPVQENE